MMDYGLFWRPLLITSDEIADRLIYRTSSGRLVLCVVKLIIRNNLPKTTSCCKQIPNE